MQSATAVTHKARSVGREVPRVQLKREFIARFNGTLIGPAQLQPHEIEEVVQRTPRELKDAMRYLLEQGNRPVRASIFFNGLEKDRIISLRATLNRALLRAFAVRGPPKYYRLVFGTDADGEQAVQLWLVDPKVRK